MRFLDFVILLVLFAFLAAGLYFLWMSFPTEAENFQEFRANFSEQLPQKSAQFYPNMRYPDSTITYTMSGNCSDKRKNDFKKAVLILEDKSVLNFQESAKGEINISCSNLAPEPDEEGHFIAGEGGPSYVINSTKYSIITSGKIALYRPESCSKPQVALHELLHALGFDHNGNKTSIMYPITNCEQTIDEEIIEEIKRLYAEPSAGDLLIESITANKSGSYLNFEVTIANYGLKDMGQFKLELTADGEIVDDFNIEGLNMGSKRHISVSNLKISRRANEILFFVRTSEPEITKENNDAKVMIVRTS